MCIRDRNYTVTLQPHKQRWLFALDNPVSLPHAGSSDDGINNNQDNPVARLLADGQLISKDTVSQVIRYRQSSSLSNQLVPLRKPSIENLQLAGKNLKTTALAREMRQQAGSDAAFAQNVLNHFNEKPFHYTLKPQLLGDAPVDEFMFQTRSGFCEHTMQPLLLS